MEITRSLHLLAMAFFVGGQLVLVAAVVPALRSRDREASSSSPWSGRPSGSSCSTPAGRRGHALEGLVFVVSLVIVWLGAELAHG